MAKRRVKNGFVLKININLSNYRYLPISPFRAILPPHKFQMPFRSNNDRRTARGEGIISPLSLETDLVFRPVLFIWQTQNAAERCCGIY